jgi:hypothetical protein
MAVEASSRSLSDVFGSTMQNILSSLEKSKESQKRKRDEEEERRKALPILIDVQDHHLKDDAHTVIDFEARRLRPYNGGDIDWFWKHLPIKVEPVMDDLQMSHLTKVTISSASLIKLHDRGADTTHKHWMATNYDVEGKAGKVRIENDTTAGAFILDYKEPKGPWEAVDAVFNYAFGLM